MPHASLHIVDNAGQEHSDNNTSASDPDKTRARDVIEGVVRHLIQHLRDSVDAGQEHNM